MFTFALLLLTQPALATVATSLECEYYLRPELARRATSDLERFVLDRPLTYASRGHLSDAGYARLGIPSDVHDKVWRRRLVAHLRTKSSDQTPHDAQGEFTIDVLDGRDFKPVTTRVIADLTPVLWRSINHWNAARKEPPPQLILPVGRDGNGLLIDRFSIGVVSDPDRRLNGGRTYLRSYVHRETEQMWLEFGVDVPCEHLPKYLDEPLRQSMSWQLITTTSVEYCRIPALTFAGTTLTDD